MEQWGLNILDITGPTDTTFVSVPKAKAETEPKPGETEQEFVKRTGRY